MTLHAKTNDAAIRNTIARYFDALNRSDVDAALKLYTDDPVMLPFLQPTVVGRKGVLENYENTFQHIQFRMETKIEELVEMSLEWAYVRTYGVRGTVHPRQHSKELSRHLPRAFPASQNERRRMAYCAI